MADNNIQDNVFILNFAEAEKPTFKESQTSGFMRFGWDNDYPKYLISLFNNSPKHSALCEGKATYVSGEGWKSKTDNDIEAEKFIANANPFESLHELSVKCDLDGEIFNGYYLEIHWSKIGGRIAAIYHLDYSKVRTNKDNTQFWYSENWGKRTATADECIPAFNPLIKQGKQILYVRYYRPGREAYSIPNYIAALNYIAADIEVSKHTLGNAQTGFSPSKLISFLNGEPPTNEAKRAIERKFNDKFTGASGKKLILEFVQGKERQTLIQDLGQSDLTKEDFTVVNTLIKDEILFGHQISSPILFGVKEQGQLGGRAEIKEAYEIFKNTYAGKRQRHKEAIFNRLLQFNSPTSEIEVKELQPLAEDYLNAAFLPYLPKEFILDKLGVDASIYPSAIDPNAAPTQQLATNDNIKNLTGRQHQNMMRIIGKYHKQILTKEQAALMLKSGLGLSDSDIETMLTKPEATAFNSDDEILEVFAAFGEQKSDFEIHRTRQVFEDAIEEELYRLDFAENNAVIEANVLDLIKKDSKISAQTLADTLKVDVSEIEAVIKALVKDGSLNQITSKEGIVTHELTAPLKDLAPTKPDTTSFSIKYSYEGPQDSKNRPFCAKLMQLDRLYSRAEIESISARLGYSVFDRRGGFYHNPKTDTTTPYCRHSWQSNLVSKRIKSTDLA